LAKEHEIAQYMIAIAITAFAIISLPLARGNP
jgi:hypothetical protein